MPKSSRRAPVTPAEFLVLEALWDLGVGTVGAVQAALPRGRRLAYNTVLTQIRFLHAKGMVLREQVGRAHVYRARYDRSEVLRRVTARFADDYFGGSLAGLARELRAMMPADSGSPGVERPPLP